MKSFLNVLVFLLFTLPLAAQLPFQTDVRDYDWNENSLNDTVKFKARQPGSHFTYYYQHIQYDLGFTYQQYLQYRMVHFVVWINDDESLEYFNKFEVEYDHYTEEIRKIKARVIADGKVIANTTIDDLMESKDGLGTSDERVDKLAIKGLRKGCFMEFFLLLEQNAYLYAMVTVKNVLPIKKLILVSQAYKVLKLTVNLTGSAAEIKDTLIGEKHYEYVLQEDVPAMKDESFSYDARRGIQLTLTLNQTVLDDPSERWDHEASERAFKYMANAANYKVEHEKILKLLKLDSMSSELEKAYSIENYVKKNFVLKLKDEVSDQPQMLASGSGTKNNFISLITQLCLRAGMNIELLFTCPRQAVYFNPAFFSLIYVTHPLIHIEGTDYYIDPLDKNARIGLLPDNFLGQNALSINLDSSLQKYTVSILKLPLGFYELKRDSSVISASINLEKGSCKINCLRYYQNTNLTFIKGYHRSKDKDILMARYISSMFGNSINVSSADMDNCNPLNYDYVSKPVMLRSDLEIENTVKTAGERIVLNAGILIGLQTRYAVDSARMMPIEINEPKIYKRIVRIRIPEGYKVVGLSDLNVKKETVLPNQKAAFGFVSTARVEADQVVLECSEYYCRSNYPAFMYKDFIETMNLAADFNAKSLVFVKK